MMFPPDQQILLITLPLAQNSFRLTISEPLNIVQLGDRSMCTELTLFVKLSYFIPYFPSPSSNPNFCLISFGDIINRSFASAIV